MELYIVRHGQTEWNKEGKLQGSTDIMLNETGRQAAIAYGEKLDAEGTSFDIIFSSPLIRAFETACLIRGRNNIEIVREDRLREVCFGVEEGSNYQSWLSDTSPYRFFFTEPDKYRAPENGDELVDIMETTKSFITEVIEPLQGKCERIMIVAHGALNKGIMCYLEGNDLAHFWGQGLQNNCDADIFDYDGNTWTKRQRPESKLDGYDKLNLLKK